MGQRLIILLAALLLALTLACEMAGGIGNALQDEPADAGGVSTAPVPSAPSFNQFRGDGEIQAEPAASTSVPLPADVPTPDPTVAAAIASLSDLDTCGKWKQKMVHIHGRWPYLPNGLKIPGEWVDAETILRDFIRDETQARKNWGVRCFRVRIPDNLWPEDRGREGSAKVWVKFPGVGFVDLLDGPTRDKVRLDVGGFCHIPHNDQVWNGTKAVHTWQPGTDKKLPVLSLQCHYDEKWD